MGYTVCVYIIDGCIFVYILGLCTQQENFKIMSLPHAYSDYSICGTDIKN